MLDGVSVGTEGAPGVTCGVCGRCLLTIRGRRVEKRYGRRWALRPVDVALERGGFIVVTGPNGSGKTTLLRLVAGLAAPTGGTLDVEPDRGRLGFLGHERFSTAT